MQREFAFIPVELPELAVLKRMGYNRHLTGVAPEQAQVINSFMAAAYELCRPAGRYLSLGIAENDGARVVLESGDVFESKSVAKLLADSSECLLLTAKADKKILAEIEKFVEAKNGVGALIYDAVASEVVDSCLGWMLSKVAMELSRFGKRITPQRYSAGYGDFLLHNQQIFYRLLEMEKLQVELSENYIFSPEKTVTAVAGIK